MTIELIKLRKAQVAAIKEPQAETEQLRRVFEKLSEQMPSFFESHDESEPFQLDKAKWNQNYFSRQALLSERNFSQKRIEHLLEIREYLRDKGVKGFVSTLNPMGTNKMNESKATSTFNISKNNLYESSEYQLSENLKKCVEDGDVNLVRASMIFQLNDNSLNKEQLNYVVLWCKNNVVDLFKEFEVTAFSDTIEHAEDSWTDKYYYSQIASLKANFSEERFVHLIKVREKLRSGGNEAFKPVSPKVSSSQGIKHKDSSSALEKDPVIKTALMIGGALATLALLVITMLR